MISMLVLVQHTIFLQKEFYYASQKRTLKNVKGKPLDTSITELNRYIELIKIHSYDGDAFHNHQDSKFKHQYITLANTNDSPMAVGGIGNSRSHQKSETYDISTNTWNEIADCPGR